MNQNERRFFLKKFFSFNASTYSVDSATSTTDETATTNSNKINTTNTNTSKNNNNNNNLNNDQDDDDDDDDEQIQKTFDEINLNSKELLVENEERKKTEKTRIKQEEFKEVEDKNNNTNSIILSQHENNLITKDNSNKSSTISNNQDIKASSSPSSSVLLNNKEEEIGNSNSSGGGTKKDVAINLVDLVNMEDNLRVDTINENTSPSLLPIIKQQIDLDKQRNLLNVSFLDINYENSSGGVGGGGVKLNQVQQQLQHQQSIELKPFRKKEVHIVDNPEHHNHHHHHHYPSQINIGDGFELVSNKIITETKFAKQSPNDESESNENETTSLNKTNVLASVAKLPALTSNPNANLPNQCGGGGENQQPTALADTPNASHGHLANTHHKPLFTLSSTFLNYAPMRYRLVISFFSLFVDFI